MDTYLVEQTERHPILMSRGVPIVAVLRRKPHSADALLCKRHNLLILSFCRTAVALRAGRAVLSVTQAVFFSEHQVKAVAIQIHSQI